MAGTIEHRTISESADSDESESAAQCYPELVGRSGLGKAPALAGLSPAQPPPPPLLSHDPESDLLRAPGRAAPRSPA